MKNAERFVVVGIIALLAGAGYWGYTAVQQERTDLRDRVAAGEFEIRDEETLSAETDDLGESHTDWQVYYPVVYPMKISDVVVRASVADTLSERIQGLSGTPYLPDGIVKLFAFGVPGPHSIWMKDMNYPIDILWADESGVIVHMVEDVSPDTYNAENPGTSQSFSSPVDSWFVVETNAGFVQEHEIGIGDKIVLPQSE